MEDLYKPYKQKKATRASKAKEKGLEPLAMIHFTLSRTDAGTPEEAGRQPFVDEEKGVEYRTRGHCTEPCDIIAEMIADDPDITAGQSGRRPMRPAAIATEAVESGREDRIRHVLSIIREALSKSIPNHRILAINRGEKGEKTEGEGQRRCGRHARRS